MNFLDLTLPTLAENLAIDDALLQAVDEGFGISDELLRIWRVDHLATVIGRSSRMMDEVHLDVASEFQIPVLRRSSGGASVVIGPGCLQYSLLIDLEKRSDLRMLDAVHQYVMSRMLTSLRSFNSNVEAKGTCDLVIDDRKISGNALKVGRSWTLYHGTVLLNMDLTWIDRLLKHPPREPHYRRGRPHSQFVNNLSAPFRAVAKSLQTVWQASKPLTDSDISTVQRISEKLVSQRYSQHAWNHQR